MPHIDSMFPSRYLKAHELCGKRVAVTIARVVQEKVRRNQEQTDVWVIYFHGKVKGLCLNKVNAKTIASLHGPNTESWIGKPILIYGTVIRAFNAQYEVVRVDTELPPKPPSQTTQPSQPDDSTLDDLDDVIDADEVDAGVPFDLRPTRAEERRDECIQEDDPPAIQEDRERTIYPMKIKRF